VELERRERDVESDVGILCGDIDDRLKLVVLRDEQFIVAFFLSSAFTDTEWERNLLISDVLPYLAELARKYGLELRLAEMRWGIRKEASSENQTSQNELERCQRESLGLFYVFLACQKYGFRPFPPRTPEGTSAKGTNARSAGGEHLPAPARKEQMQGVRGREHLPAPARKEHGGTSIRSVCPHQRQRNKCKECGGASICQHQRIRSRCKECGGASITHTSTSGADTWMPAGLEELA
jgi:hypothetical protein